MHDDLLLTKDKSDHGRKVYGFSYKLDEKYVKRIKDNIVTVIPKNLIKIDHRKVCTSGTRNSLIKTSFVKLGTHSRSKIESAWISSQIIRMNIIT